MPTRVHRPALLAPLAPETVAAWAGVAVTIAADLFRGRTLVDPAIRPLKAFASGARLAGPAVTAWCEPADYGSVHHAIAAAGPGDVIVVAAGGRPDAAMIGELLSGAARLKGIVGVVVDGPVRDVGTLASWSDFPVFGRGHTARGPSSMERGSVNEPVVFGGVRVEPGDLVLGDDDGLVVVPRGEAEARLEAALAMVRAEAGWEARLAGGESTLEVFGVPAAAEAG
jgi:4-hydroxy-4-methyl-2-oxoglutarate aldolase